ncbi:MAG: bifunctional riboflavin kinase/FAD synthetase [Bacteroidetes bacterium]|nr:bifunctional riboflavin kinase/FAD synthetase [Bacteroidota bacterium]
MKVYQSIEEFKPLANAVSTIGTFDGVHAGHQKIISRLCEMAGSEKGESVVLTFFPHPRMVLQPDDNNLKMLTTMSERIELLKKSGVDHLIIQPFNKEFSRQSAVEFVRDILVNKIGTKTLVIGYDHHFGRNREGSFKDLEEMAPIYGFRLEEIPKHVINELAVSSTKIRNSLLTGDVQTANRLLGYEFSLSGKVADGDKIGRTLGYPTANISIAEPYKLIPATGIYAVLVKVEDKLHKGMLYIGYRPVVQGKRLSVEVNIFDFNENIYNNNITVLLKARVRDDIHLSSLEELKKKMNEDKLVATKLLA